jgi:hypothetical protein
LNSFTYFSTFHFSTFPLVPVTPLARHERRGIGTLERGGGCFTSVQSDDASSSYRFTLEPQNRRWFRRAEVEAVLLERNVKIGNPILGYDAQPAIPKRKGVTCFNEIQRAQTLCDGHVMKDARVRLIGGARGSSW